MAECSHRWVRMGRHYLAGVAHTLEQCSICREERLVRARDGKVVAGDGR